MRPADEAPDPDRPGLLFLSPAAVPARWRNRAVQVALVPLSVAEAAEVLNGGGAEPEIDPHDEPLARLVARGVHAQTIALELGVSLRTVYRGIGALRDRFGVASREELVAHLAERGFGW